MLQQSAVLALFLLVGLVGAGQVSAVEETSRPNIVLLMSDDQGWGETSYNGHPHLQTLVLDDMAASGLRLDRFYAASPVCSPTRASVMTGRHANRSGAFGAGWSTRPEGITIAQILKRAGYRTGHFGKWHLGAVKKGSPLSPSAMGFDEYVSHDNFFEMDWELIGEKYRFAVIADPQLQTEDFPQAIYQTAQRKLSQTVEELNRMAPQPAFVFFRATW